MMQTRYFVDADSFKFKYATIPYLKINGVNMGNVDVKCGMCGKIWSIRKANVVRQTGNCRECTYKKE